MQDDQENAASQATEVKAEDPSTVSGSVEAAPQEPSIGEDGVRGPADHTAEMAVNQDKTPPPATPSPIGVGEQALLRRIRDIEHLLIEKEGYQMAYVFQKIPRPYYNQWKSEANELVALIISLKHRARMRQRKAG